jgi:hypothetical protein
VDTLHNKVAVITGAGRGIGRSHALFFAAEVPEGQFDMFSPENISPMVAYLAGDECSISGTVFAVQGGSISKITPMELGETIETDGPWEIDDLHKRLTTWS